ncbi:putative glucan endo-1,3-beta-glucosidase A6 -like protein [Gossypium arboreum]|uniref:glucan endo-1,3-beta-D-glucosidase n=1 Tax=Gossypium arboreum TaxID=29729 RepID=A0A0B0PLS2_GOSAR|nr:probable glucan endo-1,3-beta-glucosidase A6 [Gossypium arboreum]KHG25787.1 putative glucan endo-1,3-beta-glucosidase A6 -like protein [Gossypium arboreum]
MGLLPLYFFFLFLSVSSGEFSSQVGVNYGQLGNNLPSPKQSVKLIQSLRAKRVKIYDANHDILNALKGTNLQVCIMVPNEIINNISTSQKLADSWVETNVVPFYSTTKIRYLLVGNEVISGSPKDIWPNIVPAMRKIKKSLKAHGLDKIKVSTSMAMDVLESSFPPSNGTFRSDIADSIVRPLLQFLHRTKSFYFLDVYPYFAWVMDPKNINLDYALFESRTIKYTDPVSNLTYTNLFDQMVDSVVFAMKRLGYPDIRIWIAETGWPNAGDIDQIGANIYNAATYNRNVVKKLTAKPPIGTPARPGWVIPSLIFALYNENQKPGPGTERHFGLLYPNGTNVYGIDLSGKTPDSCFEPLPKPDNNEPYKGKIWCVAAKGVNETALSSALSYACSQGNKTCDPIQPGKKCFKPDSLFWHASYAFSSYWSQYRKTGATCYFNGLATQTAKDPSFGHCKFPSVTL